MIGCSLRILSALFVSLGCTGGVMAHPNHVSLAEANWNAKTGQLEVALKLHPNDLERALRARFRRRVVLEKAADIDRLIQKYLAEVFVVTEKDGKLATIKWVGKEISVKAAWLYFELPLATGPDGATFSNRMFFELLTDQVNTINVRAGTQRKSLSLTHDRAKRKLRLEGRKARSRK